MSTTNSPAGEDLGSTAQQARRGRILDAACALASQGGFEQVQMRTVAEHADVALGTLYRYFPSKIHLLVSALAQQLGEARGTLGRRRLPGDSAAERVSYVLGRTTRSLQRDPHLTEALTRAFMFADASVGLESQAVVAHVTGMLMSAMRDPGDDPGRAPTEDELAIVKVIGDVWLAGLVGWVAGRASADDVAGSTDVAVRLLLR